MKSNLFALLISSLLTLSVSATSVGSPTVCPDLELIKARGLSTALYFEPQQQYLIYENSHYSTEHQWLFGISGIEAKSRDLAVAKANQLLHDVYGAPSPKRNSRFKNVWVCDYQIDGNYIVQAATGREAAQTLSHR
jgi:hypothetical protein